MLTKRTNILFSQDQWSRLSKIARKKKISVGKIVRHAVDEKILTEEDRREKEMTSVEAVRKIREIRKRIKGIDYKEYINDGRKY